MTLIIGIICKDAIVLASDSQTTCGGMKRTDAEKIMPVKFATGQVLVAQAGNAGNSARATEILREMAKDKPIDDYRVPADLARLAMMQVKRELRQQYSDCTVAELQDFIWKDELQSELMLAYYSENKPYIFTIDLAVGRSDKEASWYSAIGCGANLGSYLLSEHTNPAMNSGLASIIASYVIETVCKHDAYCSPPARVGLIINDIVAAANTIGPTPQTIHPTVYGAGMVIIYSANKIAAWTNKIESIMESERRGRNKRIQRFLTKERIKGMNQLEEFIAKPTLKGFEKLKKRFSGISHLEFVRPKQTGIPPQGA